jgi:hypothetical protein
VTLKLAGPLAAQPTELGRLHGRSVEDVIYGADGWIGVTVETINGAPVADAGGNALHMAVLPGDLTGDGQLDAADAAARAAVGAGIDTGFAAYPRIDPDRLLAAVPPATAPPPDPGPTSSGSGGGGSIATGAGGGIFGLFAALLADVVQNNPQDAVPASGHIGGSAAVLQHCLFTEADLPEELRSLLAAMAGASGNGGGWCITPQAEFDELTAGQSLPEDERPTEGNTAAPEASYPFWCGTDVPDEVRAALDALFAKLGLGDPPGNWCVVRMVDEGDLALLPGADDPAMAGNDVPLDPDSVAQSDPAHEVLDLFAARSGQGVQLDWDSMAEPDQSGEVFALFAAAATIQARPRADMATQRRSSARHVWGSDELARR